MWWSRCCFHQRLIPVDLCVINTSQSRLRATACPSQSRITQWELLIFTPHSYFLLVFQSWLNSGSSCESHVLLCLQHEKRVGVFKYSCTVTAVVLSVLSSTPTSWLAPGHRWPAPALGCICEDGLLWPWSRPGPPPGWRSAGRPQSAESHTCPGRQRQDETENMKKRKKIKTKYEAWSYWAETPSRFLL